MKKKQSRPKVTTPKKPATRKRTESECSRLEEEIENFVKQCPGHKASIRKICAVTHIAAPILIHHVRIRKEKGLVHFEEDEGEIGLDTVIIIAE
jgi:hypothetical protein